MNAGVYYEDYPTLNVAFGKSVSNFEVLGPIRRAAETPASSPRAALIRSRASISADDTICSRIGNTLPAASGFNGEKVNTYQKRIHVLRQPQTARLDALGNELLAKSRRYRLRAQSHKLEFQRGEYGPHHDADVEAQCQCVHELFEQRECADHFRNRQWDSAGGAATAQAAPHAELLSSYLDYGANAGYSFTHQLTATARIDRREQDYSQSSGNTTSDVFSSGVSYSKGVLGGNFGAHYGFSWFDTNAGNAGTTGHSASLSYTRDVLGFNTGVGGQYSHNVASALVGYSQDGYSGNREHCTSAVARDGTRELAGRTGRTGSMA